MGSSNHLDAGLFTREPGTARGWVDASRGVAAAIFGPAAPAVAHGLFGQLAELSPTSAPAADAAYPARVVEAAQVLESLHRDLWQLQGDDEAGRGLGAGVLVFEPDRAYFLQVGGVLLYQQRGGRLTQIASSKDASPLLGAEVKSGIRVHTLAANAGDDFVIVASNIEQPLDAHAIDSCLSGAGDIESAADAMGALVDVSADGCTVVALRMSAPAVADVPEPTPVGTDSEWSFEGDVVGELSAFMEGLADDDTVANGPESPMDGADAAPQVESPDFESDMHAELESALNANEAEEPEPEPEPEPDTGPLFVPPAVHPMDESGPRNRSPFPQETETPSVAHDEAPWEADEDADVDEDVEEPAAPEATPSYSIDEELPPAGPADPESTPEWAPAETQTAESASRRRAVTSYRLTAITLLLLALPAAGWLFRDPVLSWWRARQDASEATGGRSSRDAPSAPVDAAPPLVAPDTTEAVLDSARVSTITLTGPRGGEVYVDGEHLDGKMTPLASLPLTPGEHDIRVVYDRLGEWRLRVTMPTDEAVVDATPHGTLRLDYGGSPLAESVRLDGTSLGRDPHSPIRVRAGEHVVQLGEDDALVRRVFVAGGDTVDVPLPAAPRGKGLLVTESRVFVGDGFDRSEQDSVWINREFVGRTPLERPLMPGVYSVRVSRKGESHIQVVDIVPDAVRVMRADFGSEARLALRHTPEAEIRAGEPLFLATHVDEADRPAARRLFCLYRVRPGVPFRSREMRRVQETSTYWVASVPEAETSGGWVEYYFTAIDTDGVQIVSEIFEIGTAPDRVASR